MLDHDVDAAAIGERLDLLAPVRIAVIDDIVGEESCRQLELGAAPARRDAARAYALRFSARV